MIPHTKQPLQEQNKRKSTIFYHIYYSQKKHLWFIREVKQQAFRTFLSREDAEYVAHSLTEHIQNSQVIIYDQKDYLEYSSHKNETKKIITSK